MKTIQQYFKEYSNLYQFEEGSPEYLIDKQDFKLCMEEYGKLMYNQALEDACKSAVTIFDTETINEIAPYNGTKITYADNDLIYKPSILKLKKND